MTVRDLLVGFFRSSDQTVAPKFCRQLCETLQDGGKQSTPAKGMFPVKGDPPIDRWVSGTKTSA